MYIAFQCPRRRGSDDRDVLVNSYKLNLPRLKTRPKEQFLAEDHNPSPQTILERLIDYHPLEDSRLDAFRRSKNAGAAIFLPGGGGLGDRDAALLELKDRFEEKVLLIPDLCCSLLCELRTAGSQFGPLMDKVAPWKKAW